MKVLFLAAEATPLIKIGGLADVAGELPRALARLGVDVQLAIPRYPALRANVFGRQPEAIVDVPRRAGSQPAQVHAVDTDGLRVWLVGGDPVDSVPGVYGEPSRDAAKFTFFAQGALQACRALGWEPDVVHAHDWHAAPALAGMRMLGGPWERVASVLSVHNLPYMGAGAAEALADYGLGPADDPLLPEWARWLPLPLGMVHADWITTVSPGYAAEIQSPAFGCGLESYLASRAARLRGILNGIDPAVWNPSTDAAVEARFSINSIDGRRPNKAALQRELGLPEQTRVPLLAMVTRLDGQKGVDLALEALALLIDKDWQMVLLGTGDAALEDRAQAFAASRPEKVIFLPRFDPPLSRRIYAGADMILVPSRYEPCGLVQLIALRYGAVPVVHATGGLKDTVDPYQHAGKGTGFLFGSWDPQSLAASLRQAMAVYADRRRWLGLQRRGMAQDNSWTRSAQAYVELYGEAVALRHPASRGVA